MKNGLWCNKKKLLLRELRSPEIALPLSMLIYSYVGNSGITIYQTWEKLTLYGMIFLGGEKASLITFPL